MSPVRIPILVLAVLAAGGCSRTDNEPGPGGVTVSEAKALDEAAEMLESRDAVSSGNKPAADAQAGAEADE